MESVLLWQLTGIVSAIGGVYLLHKAWHKRFGANLEIIGGVLLILFSIIAWVQTSGADKGTALGIIVLIIVGGLAVLISALQTPKRKAKEGRSPSEHVLSASSAGAMVWLQRIYHGLLLFLLSGLAAVSVSSALFMMFRWLGMEHSVNLTIAAFAFSILWASLAVYVGSQRATMRKSIIILGLAIIPAAALAFKS
ncbi:hypothetical protein GCM10009096_19340 [Parasphingorhabdus litoris]|uniref:Uncharacterized protein n=1 Tax=Parasphingorhabdus litoris TaxID=394733 RepID=A0ABN1AIS5_9SPHN|nr:hypothetical protein [Parasphingorhabdus litoris]